MDIKVKPRARFVEGREMFDRPQGVADCRAEIDGAVRSWKEYVPASYDGSKPVPLVLTLHGGRSGEGQNNHKAELSTAWALMAEREGFIVVYPQSLTTEYAWSAWEDFSDEERTKGLKDDLRYIDFLLELIRKKYRIDESRMYLHGQSFGDVMGSYYLVMRPENQFAAAAVLSGPVDATRYFHPDGSCVFGPERALPVVRTHGSLDLSMPMGIYQHMEDATPTYDHMKALKAAGASQEEIQREKLILQAMPSNELWKCVNGWTGETLLSVRGRYNAVTYPGNYDFHFYMVEGGGHGPSMDMADFIWSFFFSGYRYENGKRVKGTPKCEFTPDRNAVVLADGASRAYVNNRLVKLNCKVKTVNGIFYVPAICIPQLYPQLQVTLEDEGQSAVITDGRRTMQVSASNRTYVWENHLQHGDRTRMEGETLLVPVRMIGERFFGQREKTDWNIAYLSEGDGQITFDFGFLVRQLLGAEEQISTQKLYELEKQILDSAPQPGK